MNEYPEWVENLVIGSGPSSSGVVLGLLESGCVVTVIDVGKGLPSEKKQFRDLLAAKDSRSWDENSFGSVDRAKSKNGIGSKLLFGSSFPYASSPTEMIRGNVIAHESHAQGGLSNVWGATLLPFSKDELSSWPLDLQIQMQEAYKSVLTKISSIGSIDDDLSAWYSNYSPSKSYKPALPLEYLIKDRRNILFKSAIEARVGLSRLAINSDCVFCSQCLSGCVYTAIFQSFNHILSPLIQRSENLNYFSGLKLKSFSELTEKVICTFEDEEGRDVIINTHHLFLGAGVISTSRIILNSLSYINEVIVRDSQTIFAPILHFHKHHKGSAGISLSNVTIAFKNLNGVMNQAQIYPYDKSYKSRLDSISILNKLPKFFVKIAAFALKKSVIAIVYLDQDQSASIKVTRGNSADSINLEPVFKDSFAQQIKLGLNALGSFLLTKRFFLVKSLKQVTLPGEGVHLGSSFPISTSSTESTSDFFGRPAGLKRVFLVDSSSLPRIPAGSVTLSIIANAFRIGKIARDADY